MNEELKNEIVTEENENEQQEVIEEVEVVETEEVNEEAEEVKEVSTLSKVLTWTKRILSWLGSAILAILLIIVGWISIDKFIIGNPVPSFMGYSVLNIATGSMQGTIDEGDVIIIKKTDDYKIGDIVTYLPEGYDRKTISTTHRIIGIDENGAYICKGDANDTKDTVPVKKEYIVGEVITDENGQPLSVIRNVGIFVEWVKDGGGLIYIISFIVIIGGGAYLLLKKDEKEEK